MVEYIRVCTSRFLQSIREDREPPIVQRARRQVPLFIGGVGEADDGAVVPGQD